MELASLFLVLSFVFACTILTFKLITYSKTVGGAKLPPGPRPFPIIGSLPLLSTKPHKSLARLSKTYGPLMMLKLGSINLIVISSPRLTKEFLQTNAQNFSDRFIPDCLKAQDHDKFSLAYGPISDQWRYLLKISKMNFFSVQMVDATHSLRRKKIVELLDFVHEKSLSGQAISVRQAAHTTSLNFVTNLFFSMDLAHYYDSSLSHNIVHLFSAAINTFKEPNIADYFPALGFMDPQGIRKRLDVHFEKLLAEFGGIIEQRLVSRASSPTSSTKPDVLDNFLDLTERNKDFSINDLKHLLIELFIAGYETTSVTLEWAMAELLRNQNAMTKLRIELQELLGNEKIIQESDIKRLPYLQAVVKETHRLHPAAVLIIPRIAEEEAVISGYKVPKNAKVVVNLWAIGRDPKVWPNPNSFVPERFLESENNNVKGLDFELFTFGAGKRICPGVPLVNRMLHLMLATLIHNFNWKLEDGKKLQDIDMDDKLGVALHKSELLCVIPFKA